MLLQVLDALYFLLAESAGQYLLAPSQKLDPHQGEINIMITADIPCKADINLSMFS